MRKVQDFWKCPTEARNAIQGVNIAAIEDIAELADAEGNSFEVEREGSTVTVYNLVAVESGGEFLVDSDGRRWSTWAGFCSANAVAVAEEG
jgi:hypothetical protein